MLVLKNEIYPRLSLGDIKLGKNNINVKAFFTMQENGISSFTSSTAKILQYSEVYFFLSTPRGIGLKELPASLLAKPSTRVQNIAGAYKRNSYSATKWYEYLSKIYPSTVLSLDKILKESKNITSSELSKSPNIKDINFEVNIPISEQLYDKKHTPTVRVHAFVHLNVSAMLDAGEIPSINNHTAKYLKMGGNFKSKTILQEIDGQLQVPMKKTILVTPDGKAHNGNYVSSGRNKFYVPTSAGSPTIHLQKAEVDETSITAEYLIEKHGRPPMHQAPIDKTQLEFSYSKPFVDTTQFEVSRVEEPKLYKPGFISQLNKQRSRDKILDANTNYITNTYHFVDASDTQSNCVYFDLEWEKIVKHKTQFGYLIDLVKNKKDVKAFLSDGTLSNSNLSEETILSKVRIKEISIKRNRIKKGISTNAVGSLSYNPDMQDEKTVLRVKNFDNSSTYRDEAASIYIDEAKSTYDKKCVVFHDHEVYSDPRDGQYCYTIEITLEDRVGQYFSNLLLNFRNSLNRYDIFLKDIETYRAQIPEKDKIDQAKILESNSGNYNSLLGEIINTYLLMLCWLGKDMSSHQIIALRNNLQTSVIPNRGGTISGLEKFKLMCDSAVHDFQKLINQLSIKPLTENFKGQVGASNVASQKFPYETHTFKIPGKSKTIEAGKIMLSYPKTISQDLITRSQEDGTSGLSLKPSRYVYREDGQISTLMSRQQIRTETDQRIAKTKALILEDAIKNSQDGQYVKSKINTPKPSSSLDMVFGISGISIAIPSNSGTFETDRGKITTNSTEASERQAGLSVALEQSVASSTRTLSGRNLLDAQEALQEEKTKASKKRGLILEKTIDVLSAVRDFEPKTRVGSRAVKKITRNKPPMETLFDNRSGLILIGMNDKGPEMNFQPLSRETLSRVKGSQITIKIEGPTNKTSKEKYEIVDNIFTVSKKALQDFMKQRR